MIFINELNIAASPDLLMYFIPGYLAIATYRFISSINKHGDYDFIASCVISYLCISLIKLIFPSVAAESNSNAILTISSCLLAIVSSGVISLIVKNTFVKRMLGRYFKISPASTVIVNSIKVDGNGTTMRIYFKDRGYYVEGAVATVSPDKDDPWIALQYYTLYSIDDNRQIGKYAKRNDRFLLNANDAQHIEVWDTVPAKKKR